MNLYAIFGNPVKHSISPTLHNFAFEKFGFKGCYTKILVEDENSLKTKFLSLNLKGANITVPHKEAAYLQADEVLGIAKEIEAVNTWYLKNNKIIAYNTDAPGFYESIAEFDFEKVLILGAGGTAKAISVYLKNKNIECIVLNRSSKRLDFFKKRDIKAYTWDEFKTKKFDLIVNTTSAGLNDNNFPAPKDLLDELLNGAKYAVDVIYNRLTPFLALAKDKGLIYKDGTDMLLYQGVLAFEIFTDYKFDKKSIKEAFKEAARLLN